MTSAQKSGGVALDDLEAAVHSDGVPTASFCFNLVTEKFYETWDFYTEQLGFRTVDESDCYVKLVHPSGARIGILRHETEEQHPELVCATDGRGFWLSFDVADVDEAYERLRAAGVSVVHAPVDEPRGARYFTVRDPNGVLVRIALMLPSAG